MEVGQLKDCVGHEESLTVELANEGRGVGVSEVEREYLWRSHVSVVGGQ